MNVRFPRLPALTTALIAVNLALAVQVILPFLPGKRIGLAKPPAAALDLPEQPIEPQRSISFAAILESPLFHATRDASGLRFMAPAIDQPSPPSYRLAGFMEIPDDNAIAVVFDTFGGTTRVLQIGDEIEGWIVSAMEHGRVEFRYGEIRFDLVKPETPVAPGLSNVTHNVDEPARP